MNEDALTKAVHDLILEAAPERLEEIGELWGKYMSLIPPAELSSLFRHPDYSVNGRATWIIAGDRAIAEALMAA